MTNGFFLKQLGEQIALQRKRKKLTQLDLGAKIDMEKSNLSAIENGRQNASSLTLKKIADALETTVTALFTFEK